MKQVWIILACALFLHFVSANKRKSADASNRRGSQAKTVSGIIDIDEQVETAVELEASGNGIDGNLDGIEDSDASGDGTDEASGDFESVELTKCQMMREQSPGNVTGQFIPHCAPDGQFEIVQCHVSTNECWCVNPMDGQEVPRSRRRGPQKPSCSPSVVVSTTSTVASTEHSSTMLPKLVTKILSSVELSTRITTSTMSPSTTQQPTTTRLPSTVFSTTQIIDPDNKINQFPNNVENNVEVGSGPDTENNYVERPNVLIEPKARKMTLRSTIVGQPGILAGIIGAAVIVLLCLVLLVMFIIYRMHRKSQDPAIYYIDKSSRNSLPSSNKKAGYMKALDHDVYT